jgi:hypothetical protein
MPHKGIIISFEAFIAITIATTAFMLLSFRTSILFNYGFSYLDNSYSAVGHELSEQRLLYDEYASNLNFTVFSALANGEGYGLQGFYNSSVARGAGRIVAIAGRVYVVVPK